MIYSHEVQHMCVVKKGPNHGPAPIPEEGKWVRSKEIKDISGLTHGIGWCAPQQGACKLTLNIKDGIIEEALIETIGCSGMTHSAAMASEILPGKTLLEALNTDLVCDAINTAMRELFLQIVYGRSQSAFSEGGLPIGASLEDLGKGMRSQVGTMFRTGDRRAVAQLRPCRCRDDRLPRRAARRQLCHGVGQPRPHRGGYGLRRRTGLPRAGDSGGDGRQGRPAGRRRHVRAAAVRRSPGFLKNRSA